MGFYFFVAIKFLIIRFSSIGDIVLTTPVVRCLKLQVEGAEVHFVTKIKYAPILQANPYIDKLHYLKGKVSDLIPQLKSEKFNYIIDLHQNIRSNHLKSRLHVPGTAFKKLDFEKWLLVNFRINWLPELHVVDRYLETIEFLGVSDDHQGLDYFIPEGEEFDFGKLPESFRSGYMAVVIAGTYFTKRLPVKKLTEICSAAEVPVILIGGKREVRESVEFLGYFRGRAINLVGRTTLSESASLVKNAGLVLTNDTGLMHIASAFHKKILSFWGNTVREFGMTPYNPDPDSKILEVPGLKCRPCSKLGHKKCPRRHFRCMNNIDVNEAADWIKRNLPPHLKTVGNR